MTDTITFTVEELRPPREAVLGHQGIPPGRAVNSEIEALFEAGVRLLEQVATPAGILAEISKRDFETVYSGEGHNDAHTPVAEIYLRAERLALFAVTLGKRVVDEIRDRFRSNELALGAMLDSAASVAADKLATAMTARLGAESAVLNYSPGYCGWHISGQRKLFEYLRPERIGIVLRDSFLMDPLKSVSGVMIAGPPEIHRFPASYSFCDECKTRSCRARIRTLCADLAREDAEES